MLLERPRKDLTSNKYTRLTVIDFSHFHIQPSGQRKAVWDCLCECGNELKVSHSNLVTDHTQSCGCLKQERITKHGMSGTTEYRSYREMKNRCTNKNDTGYSYYGERGIKICDRWLEEMPAGFNNFYEDLGPCPEGMSLERIEVEGDYTPENCKWETDSMQSYNTRIKSHNTSGRTGVGWDSSRNKWIAQIGYLGKVISLGRYFSFDEAVSAREDAEMEYFGRTKE